MTTGNRHRVRCTCWWLDVTALDQAPHSSYIRSFSELDCPAHGKDVVTFDDAPGTPPVTPRVKFDEPEDRKITFRDSFRDSYRIAYARSAAKRRRWRWPYFWLAVAVFNLLATCVNIWQQDLAGLWITGPALVGSLWLVQTTA